MKISADRINAPKPNERFCTIIIDEITASVDTITKYIAQECPTVAAITSIDKVKEKTESDILQLAQAIISRVAVLELHAMKKIGLKGETPEARFDSFISLLAKDENKQTLKEKYPVMFAQLILQIQQYQEKVYELLMRLECDFDIIKKIFLQDFSASQLVDFNFVGDPHCGGRNVAIVVFNNGSENKSIVYKPRSLAVDKAFYQFLSWLNQMDSSVSFRSLSIIQRENYAWCEFIEDQPCQSITQVKNFYQRLGGLLAVMQLLIGSDIHAENIIAYQEFPMIIDLECLLRPIVNIDDFTANESRKFFVTDTHFLPKQVSYNSKILVDFSAFQGCGEIENAMPTINWKAAGTDEMIMERTYQALPAFQNRPTLTKENINPLDYTDDFILGYQKVYRIINHSKHILLSSNSPLEQFSSVATRFLIRDTACYGNALKESYHPELLHDAEKRALHFKHIMPQDNFFELFSSELNDLQSGDVPYFSVNSSDKNIFDSQGKSYLDKIAISGFDRMQQNLQHNFSEADLKNQLNLIGASFYAARLNNAHEATPMGVKPFAKIIDTSSYSSVAKNLVHEHLNQLMETMITNSGRVYWPCVKQNSPNQFAADLTDIYLYNGISGIGLVFALAGKTFNEEKYLNIARHCANSLRLTLTTKDSEFFNNIGGFVGLGGIIYALKYFHEVLGDESVNNSLQRCAAHLKNIISFNKEVDIISGSAGCLAALVSAYDLFEPDVVNQLIDQCLVQLFSLYPDPAALPDDNKNAIIDTALLGYAHGVAGISWALDRVLTLNQDFLDGEIIVNDQQKDKRTAITHWIAKALQYERQFFTPEKLWPDLRNNHRAENHKNSWCHGALGVGLAKADLSTMWHDEILATEIDSAKKSILQDCEIKNPNLCHSNLGNLNFVTRNTKQWDKLVQSILNCAQDDTLKVEGIPIKFMPGLMTGRAGIIYQLLQIINPDVLANPFLLK